jgi:hypothetical protein
MTEVLIWSDFAWITLTGDQEDFDTQYLGIISERYVHLVQLKFYDINYVDKSKNS